MINKFNKFNKMINESSEQQLLDKILDKLSDYGYENLSQFEKEILNKASKYGVDSLKEYIDDEELNYDDSSGRILINGVPYDEWSKKQNDNEKKKKKETEWDITKRGATKTESNVKKPTYIVKVFKNLDSSIRTYYVVDDEIKEKGMVIKYIAVTNHDPNLKYGVLTHSKKIKWKTATPKEIFDDISNDFDQQKLLTIDETNNFEILLNLRSLYRKSLKSSKTVIDDKLLSKLNKLFNKFSKL